MSVGGTMYPKSPSLHHIRLVPVTEAELVKWRAFRELVEKKGRPFAAYVEPCTSGAYYSKALSMREYTRSEMWKHKLRGATMHTCTSSGAVRKHGTTATSWSDASSRRGRAPRPGAM